MTLLASLFAGNKHRKKGNMVMYEYFDLDYENTVFEWDEEKTTSNFTKHGLATKSKKARYEHGKRYDESFTSTIDR